MSRFLPTAAEAEMLRFLLPLPSLWDRLLLAGGLFAVGLALWCLFPVAGVVGLPLVLAGHLPLWVRRQTSAPGGATPRHEEVWVPVEEDWLERVEGLERRGEAWDATPWDLTNLRGCFVLLVVLALLGVGVFLAGARLGLDALFRPAVAAPLVVVPLWLNGIRTTWNPSELRKKGEALAVAREVLEADGAGDFQPVPMLALREGRRGKYPVDARLMLRPVADDGSGFLGVQVQVALNNVQGKDYPYLYCVVLGKAGFRLPASRGRHRRPEGKVELVFERGGGEDVSYLVIRQHADTRGGWHTKPEHVREIVSVGLAEGRAARAANRPGETG